MSAQRVLRTALILAGALALVPTANAQCGPTVSARFGGEVSAVAQVNTSTLLVAHGSEVELYSISNPSAPAPFSPHRKAALDAPAVKISMTAGFPQAFVLLETGAIDVVNLSYSPLVSISSVTKINHDFYVDVLADGQRVYAASLDEYAYGPTPYVYSSIDAYDLTTGTPVFTSSIDPLTENYGYDRLAKVGNTLWAGFHELDSAILGVDGINIADPSHLTRTGAALTNANLGVYTHVSAMAAIGINLFVSYLHDNSPNDNEWMRAVDVSSPPNPVWVPAANAVTLSGTTSCMTAVGSKIRIAIDQSGIGTWDVSNPFGLTWQGAYFDTHPNIGQMVSGSTTDYWAAGHSGLMTMNTTNPASVTARSTPIIPLPIGPTVVRQRGNTTAVLDTTPSVLRLYDYTLPEAQQLRSTVAVPSGSFHLELANLSGGAITLACVATEIIGSGNAITIIDITNPASPAIQSTIPNIPVTLLSASGSRLYAFTLNSDFKIIELAQPLSPQIRSTTHFGGNYYDYTCMTSWSNNAAAMGTTPYGLWLIDTTNATAPFVSAVWNPVSGYHVNSIAKGNNYLYVNASVGPTSVSSTDTRLESLTVTNMTSPTLRFVAHQGAGFGAPGRLDSLTYVASPAAKLLVGVRQGLDIPDLSDKLVMYELPPGLFTNEAVPFPIANMTLPYAQDAVAANSDGSRILVAGGKAGLYQIATPTNWAPGFGSHPSDQHSCSDSPVDFAAFASGNPTSVTYQWYRGSTPLTDGTTPWGSTISGATQPALEITNVAPSDVWYSDYIRNNYYCTATNSCGSTYSSSAHIFLSSADFNGDGDLGTDADIAAFFACLGGVCCPHCGSVDFNGDGDLGTDADIASFFRVLAGGPC